MSKLKSYCWLVLVALPLALLIGLVWRYGVHVPFWDQWELVEIFREHNAGTLSLADFWAQHNEHRIFFPRLIMFGLGLLTAWDPYYETFVSIGLAAAICAVILLMLRRQPDAPKQTAAFSILAAWLVFSPAQWENWLWGWQIQWFLSVLGAIVALWALTAKRLKPSRFLIAVVGGLVATLSLANGFTVWPIGLLILLLRPAANWQRLAWAAIGLAASVAHYLNYVNPGYHPSKTEFLHRPIEFAGYVAVYLGRPLATTPLQSAIFGAGLVALFVVSAGYLWLKQRVIFRQLLPWLGMAAYAGLAAVFTAISRLGLGVGQSFASRYVTISILFTLATVVVVAAALKSMTLNRSLKRVVAACLLGFVIVMTLINYWQGTDKLRQQSDHLKRVEQCLQTAVSPSDECLSLGYPNGPVAWQRLEFLRQQGLGGFNR